MLMRRVFAALAILLATAEARADDALTPPTVSERAEAKYPPEALKEKLEANVELELSIDETGHVIHARVTAPAGHGFDESALLAVKKIVFVPAKKNGAPVAATIDFTYE